MKGLGGLLRGVGGVVGERSIFERGEGGFEESWWCRGRGRGMASESVGLLDIEAAW
jgi:hypothetical protein